MISTQGLSTYNGLLVKVNGRTGEFHHFVRSAQWGFSYALSRFNATQGDQAFSAAAIDNDCTTCFYGPAGADRTHQFTINTLFDLPWGFRFNTLTRWASGVPVTLRLANQGNGPGEIFTTDLTGDGTVSDVLPGTNLGAFNRSVGSVSALNRLITNFNNNFAGKPTPAGQALIGSGLFTLGQLQALGGVIPTIPLAPADQVRIDSFWSTDFRVSKVIRIKEKVHIEPLVDIFNVFNKANYDPPGGITNGPLSGFLSGNPGTVNGTAQGQRTNKFGLGVGSFSPGIPRAFQFGARVTF